MKNISLQDIATFIGILAAFVTTLKYFLKKKREHKKLRDITDFITAERTKDYKSNFVRTKCVDMPPDIEWEPRENFEYANRRDLINFFFKQVFTSETKKIYLILGGAGMGKTTFMVNLFLEYNSWKSIHKYRMKYISLSTIDADKHIEKFKKDDSPYQDGSNTILLLDAFDEDFKALANYDDRLNQIVETTRSFRKVILTCRTSFFPSQDREVFSMKFPMNGEKNGYLTFQKKYIAPFSNDEVRQYIKKKYGLRIRLFKKYYYKNPERIKIERIVEKVRDLSVRPMLLEQIDLLPIRHRTFRTEYEIYAALLEGWIKRESYKQPNNTDDDFLNEMKDFVDKAAINIYNNFRSGKGMFIDFELINQIAEDRNVKLKTIDMTTRSQLNRNPNNQYKFSHKSILEYLLAKIDFEAKEISSFINFDTFDFGLKIRNQMIFDYCKHNGAFYCEGKNGLVPFRKSVYDDLAIKTVFAPNVSFYELRKLNAFTNLERVYLLEKMSSKDIIQLDLPSRLREYESSKKDSYSIQIKPEYDARLGFFNQNSKNRIISYTIEVNLQLIDTYFDNKNLLIYTAKKIENDIT